MFNYRLTTVLFAAAIGMVAVAPKAGADEWDKMTYVTISGPVVVPGGNSGVVLPAGKYVFKLVDSSSDRHIVTVQNDRQNHTYTTFFAVNDYRLIPTGHTVFTYYETPAGSPKAIRDWYYPGDNYGQHFLYKKSFTQVAQVTPPPPPPAPAPAPQVQEQPQPQPEIAQNTPPPPPAPAPQAEPTPQPAPAPETPAPAPTLPQTASNMPLFALFGFGCIGLALFVGLLTRRLN